MATWKRVATDQTMRETTVSIPLYLSSTNGLKADNVSFLRTTGYVNQVSVNPQIQFDAATTNDGVQSYSAGPITSPSDPAYAYIDYDGDILGGSMDASYLDDTLIEAVGGAAFSIPLGDASYPQHKIQVEAMISVDQLGTSSTPGAAGYIAQSDQATANIHFNLWQADLGQGVSFGNGLPSQRLRFKLIDDHLLGTDGDVVSMPTDAGSIKYQTYKEIEVPLEAPTSIWGGRSMLYLLGCWVDSTAETSNLDPDNSINWPMSAGTGNCSMKAWVNVTYRRYNG